MDKKLLFALVTGCILTLCSCSKREPIVLPPPPEPDHSAVIALSEAASSVSQSLTDLKATEQAAMPPKSVSTPPSPASYGMGIPATLDWNGPVEPLVAQIANATNYSLKILGTEPSIPIIVTISAKNEAIGNVLKDAGYQCGNRAQIIVYPSIRQIELRYTD